MPDLESIIIRCSSWEEIVAACNEAVAELPRELRKRLSDIFTHYLAQYGIEGVYEKLNNRSVAQIFAEFLPAELPAIESGEVDGLRYTLYEAPKRPTEPPSSENKG